MKNKVNDKSAIKSLERLRNQLMSGESDVNAAWAALMCGDIKLFFGDESYEFKHASMHGLGNDKKISYIQFINGCIDKINDRGVYKPPIKNIFSSMNDVKIMPMLFGIISASFLAGTAWGTYSSNLQNIELRIENKNMRDSILLIAPTDRHLPNSIDNPTN